jgi:hypothetical protein
MAMEKEREKEKGGEKRCACSTYACAHCQVSVSAALVRSLTRICMQARAGGGARRVVLVFFLSFGTGHRGTGAQPPHAAASSDCDAGEPRHAHARKCAHATEDRDRNRG